MKNNQRILYIFLGVDCAMVVLHLLFGAHFDLLNLDRENNLPSYWSGTQLAFIAIVGFFGALLSRERTQRFLWAIFGALFLYLQFDEISSIHEHITYYISVYIKPSRFFASPTYMWVIFFSPFIIAAFVFLLRCRHLFLKKRFEGFLFMAGIFSMVSGGVIIELVTGLLKLKHESFYLTAVEEFFEMVGASLVLFAVITTVQSIFKEEYEYKHISTSTDRLS